MYQHTQSRGASRNHGQQQSSRHGGFSRGGRPNRFARGPQRNQNKNRKKIDARFFVNKPAFEAEQNAPVYEVKHSFQDFALTDKLKSAIVEKKYTAPTPIQDQAIPAILEGRDVIGIANTGTGKTAAFLLPLINKVLLNKQEKVLIVAPTRELAVQINAEMRSFTRGAGIWSVLAIGGTSMFAQRNDLKRPHNFVIGTPGRLIDLIKSRMLDLSQFHNIVLDEVDRMVDIGFIRDVQYLISLLPEERQSLFFSATLTDKVNEILRAFVKNPVRISVKTHETAQSVEQDVMHVKDKSQKTDMLHDLLIQKDFEKVIVFARTKHGVEKLSRNLEQRGFRVASIHGNKSQNQRQRALQSFKNDHVQILLATDVASRGIDVADVTHVINFDAPESYDDYVHRIGRTGRANKKGKAITFVE